MLYRSILFFLSISSLLQPLSAYENVPEGMQLKRAGELPHLGADCLGTANHADSRKLIISDNDGVLKTKEGDGATLQARRVLLDLSRNPQNTVVVISARALTHLEQQYGNIPNLLLAGRLGAQRSDKLTRLYPQTASFPDHLVRVQAVKDHLKQLFPHIRDEAYSVSPNSLLLKYKSQNALTDDEKQAISRMQSLVQQDGYKDFEYAETAEYATLTHKDGHKGKLAELLLQSEEFQVPNFLGITFGDEAPDEKMHQVMNQHAYGSSLTVLVNSNKNLYTHASHRLNSDKDVVRILKEFI